MQAIRHPMCRAVSPRSLRGSLMLALGTFLSGGIPAAAFANCVIGNTSAICDNSPPNPYTSTVGNGRQNNYLVTVGGAASASDAVQIAAGNNNAIAINSGGTITIGDNASLTNGATSSGGATGSSASTVDFNSNTTVTIGLGATVASLGKSPKAEAINPRGINNTVINNGLIYSIPAYAIFFDNGSNNNTVINNATGVIRGTRYAIGSYPGVNTILVNYGLIDGNVFLRGRTIN